MQTLFLTHTLVTHSPPADGPVAILAPPAATAPAKALAFPASRVLARPTNVPPAAGDGRFT